MKSNNFYKDKLNITIKNFKMEVSQIYFDFLIKQCNLILFLEPSKNVEFLFNANKNGYAIFFTKTFNCENMNIEFYRGLFRDLDVDPELCYYKSFYLIIHNGSISIHSESENKKYD